MFESDILNAVWIYLSALLLIVLAVIITVIKVWRMSNDIRKIKDVFMHINGVTKVTKSDDGWAAEVYLDKDGKTINK